MSSTDGAGGRTADLHCSVAVIGAGPYGLSSASYLRSRGLDVIVLGATMASWREGMPLGMRLKSSPDASSISAPTADATLGDFLASVGESPLAHNDRASLAQFIDYGTWFERRFVADVHHGSMVTQLERGASGFRLDLETGESLEAAAVVVAAGHRPHAYMPPALADLASATDLVTHACRHTDLARFAGRRVAVIGAGQSALETAAILGGAGADVVLLARRQELVWDDPPRPVTMLTKLMRPTTGIGPGWPKRILEGRAELVRRLPRSTRMFLLREVLGPSGAYWLRDRFEAQPITVSLCSRVQRVDESRGGVRLHIESGLASSELQVDHVIAATGYHFDVDRLGFLSPTLREQIVRVNGFPRLDGDFESSVPGLYFTGLAAGATFGPLLRFVCGTRFAGPRLAAAVARAPRGQLAAA